MKMRFLKKFVSSEDGAITVDWVVLTAAVAAFATAAILSIHGSSGNVGNVVQNNLDSRIVGQ